MPYPCGYSCLQKYESLKENTQSRTSARFPISFEGAFEFFGEIIDDDDEDNSIHDHEQLLFDCLLELHSWFIALPTASLQEETVRILWNLLKVTF